MLLLVLLVLVHPLLSLETGGREEEQLLQAGELCSMASLPSWTGLAREGSGKAQPPAWAWEEAEGCSSLLPPHLRPV